MLFVYEDAGGNWLPEGGKGSEQSGYLFWGCILRNESPLSVIAFAGKFTGQQCEPLFCNTIAHDSLLLLVWSGMVWYEEYRVEKLPVPATCKVVVTMSYTG